MTHKSKTIECNQREAEIIANATSYNTVVKLGAGKELRMTSTEFPLDVPDICRKWGRGASVYAVAMIGGIQTSALCAIYRLKGGWKFADGFDPDRVDAE